jgi:uncharacterized protein (TIGR02246 family)
MNARRYRGRDSRAVNETDIRALYRQILNGWNRRSADAIADLFVEDGVAIDVDGSALKGRAEIAAVHKRIFDQRSTGAFVGKVRSVQFLSPDVAVLSAVAGMVMPGKSDLDPQRDSIQKLVAAKRGDHWSVAFFQNIPAQLHGRSEEAQSLREELRRQL